MSILNTLQSSSEGKVQAPHNINQNPNMFELDGVLISGFNYILEWESINGEITELINYSVDTLIELVNRKIYFPKHRIYLFDEENIFATTFKSGSRGDITFEFKPPQSLLSKIISLSNHYNEQLSRFKEDPISPKETLDNACYFILEDFINFRKGNPHLTTFKSYLEVRNRNNLSEEFKRTLDIDPTKFTILNPVNVNSFSVSQRK